VAVCFRLRCGGRECGDCVLFLEYNMYYYILSIVWTREECFISPKFVAGRIPSPRKKREGFFPISRKHVLRKVGMGRRESTSSEEARA
jgi:hypothetical protein